MGFYYRKQGKSTAFSTSKPTKEAKINPYKAVFRQGATIVPRTCYFVRLAQERPPDFKDRIVNLKTSEAVKSDSKAPWKGIDLSGHMESRFLFRTALSKSILPFALHNPEMVVLPHLRRDRPSRQKDNPAAQLPTN